VSYTVLALLIYRPVSFLRTEAMPMADMCDDIITKPEDPLHMIKWSSILAELAVEIFAPCGFRELKNSLVLICFMARQRRKP